MKDPILHAERKVRYWQRKLEELKKEEKGKRDISPTPPIENKGKKEENSSSSSARARERFSKFIPSAIGNYALNVAPTLRLIVQNYENRKESIWILMKEIKKHGTSRK